MFDNKFLLLFSLTLILLLVIPSTFGAENTTDSLNYSLNATAVSNDFYFDVNAGNDHGDGTPDNPYRELRDGRILDDSVIHLKNGEYSLSQLNTHKNISFIGEDASKTIINGNNGILFVNTRLTLSNITISNLSILNLGNMYASNTIFSGSSATHVNNAKSYGGAIQCVDKNNNAYLTNCTFMNHYADYGGAIYINGGILEITDCIFINNTALNFGGAIACDSMNSISPKLTVKRTKFIASSSLSDAGGAIYLKSGTFKGEDLYFSSNNATFGGAICLLKSYTHLTDVYAFNNTAKYDGGVIYQIYGNLTLTNSQLVSNSAKNGGALFSDNSFYGCVENNSFVNNSAQILAGAFYSLMNDYFKVENITYINNTAYGYDDFYQQDNISFIFSSSDYTFYNNELDGSFLPSKYFSESTPVKDQLNGGNCWAFATLGALESAILKSSGDEIDLSEENMKNLASSYSHFGWDMDTNEGGYQDMSLGYLVSWLGPVLEEDDEYSDITLLSPVLDSVMHVQNMLFLKKSSHYSLYHIKSAIRDYGGLYAGIYMNAYYDYTISQVVQCYRGNLPCNHAVVLVGWDDDFYIPGAPGRGAWIAKNSWGEKWGNNGYFYVSYFDTSCPKLGDNAGAIAFILNDTIKYDKNYQYDVAKTDYFLNTASTVWYKNLFTATDNEYLAAVSTYFEKQTSWDLFVRVNNVLEYVKSGKSNAGYYTLDLDQFVPLKIGDVFEVMFKITVEGDAGVPISESISLNNYFYHENISYISYDGKNWQDLFELEWTYPDHIYYSQVACIKAFTILNPIETNISLYIENKTSDSAVIVAYVLNQWGYPVNCGEVTFTIGENSYAVDVVNGIAKHSIELKSSNITVEFYAMGYSLSNVSAELKNPMVNTTISLNITGQYNPVNITAEIMDEYGNPVKCGSVIFQVSGNSYSVEVSNGTAKLENLYVDHLKFGVNAYYSDIFYYNSSRAFMAHEVSLIDTRIYMEINANDNNNPINITAYVVDKDNNPVTRGHVVFRMPDKVYNLDVIEGMVNLIHAFSDIGENIIYATYYDDYIYNSSVCNETLLVSRMKVNLTFDMIVSECNVIFGIGIKDCIRGFAIIIYINDTRYDYLSTEGSVLAEIDNLDKGLYNYTVMLVSPIYKADDVTGQFVIVHQKTQIVASDATVYYNGGYEVCLKDDSGNVIPDRDVYLTIDGNTYKKRTDSQGIAIFNIPFSYGLHTASVSFIGDDEYLKSSQTTLIVSKSTIELASYTYSLNSKYIATLRDFNGNLLVNKPVDVVLNGVSYKLNTDGKGQISLDINLNVGSYPVKIINSNSGQVQVHNIKIVKRITKNNDLSMYYGAGKLFKVRVCDDFGKYVKGIKVTFKINGKTYHSATDNEGYASLKISQKPGKYTVTTIYNGVKVTNKITVKSTIITKNIKVKKAKSIKFTAKLLNKNGKILKNKKIIFKFKGKTYKIKTNKKGKAVLKITKKYKKGKYTISSKYGKLTIKNKITIK